MASLLAARRQLDRRQRHAEADHVGEHVAGVGEQGQRAGGQPGHDLHHHEHAEDAERGEQAALVAGACASRLAVGVAVPLVVTAAHRPILALNRSGGVGAIEDLVELDQVGGGDHTYELVRSEEHTSELQSLMRISYAAYRLKKKK